jgi:hypothetical protein
MTPREAYDKCYDEGKRIPELENIIITDPFYSYRYARNIIEGRFIEGEKIISTDPDYSYFYSLNIIKGPFYLCHHVIFNSKSEYKDDYIRFLKSINCDLIEIGEWLI